MAMRIAVAEVAEAPSADRGQEARVDFSPVLPRPLEYTERGGGKPVHELQRLIEEALVLLANEEATSRTDPFAEPPASDSEPTRLGPAPASDVRHKSSVLGRIAKTVLGLAAALFIALVPLKNVLVATSTEAFVNAPLVSVIAPVAGTFELSDTVGQGIDKHGVVGLIAPKDGGAKILLAAPGTGTLWSVNVPSGTDVAAGQEVATIAACGSTSVIATVSETVYDRLVPGMDARFNFLGSDRFYVGKVANLLGRSAASANLAIPLTSLTKDAYRVIVSVPGLSAIPDCAIGKRGEIVFNTARG